MKLIRLIAALALCASAQAQTFITVTADTNRVVRTNFTIGNAQVTGLSSLLDGKLNTNGNAGALTNITGANVVGTVALASNISGILAISNGGTGSSSASNARVALGLGTAATNAATAFQPASTNLDALASGDGSSLTNVATTDASQLTNFPASVLLTNSEDASFPTFLLRTNGDGGGLTNLSAINFLPDYTGNDGKVLAVATGGTNIEWTAISNTVADASQLTNFPTLNQNTTGTASNVTGIVQITNGGTGTNSAAGARLNLLPSYTGNSNKVLAVNAGETDVEWVTPTGGGGTSGVTSVDVSGGSTGLTTSGGPITNSGTITIGGTLSIAAGGTGATNAAAAIEALLPSYTGNEEKILALNSNATSLVWTTNAGGGGGGSGTVTSVDASGGSTGMNFTGGPVTTNGTLTLGGTLAVTSGGTGASDLSGARVNLLPAYTNNAGKVLAVNSSTNDLEWVSVATAPVSIANGGTGGTNTNTALQGLGLVNADGSVYTLLADPFDFAAIRISTTNAGSGLAIGSKSTTPSNSGFPIAIGHFATVTTNQGIAIGRDATVADGGVGEGVAIGASTYVSADGGAIGRGAGAASGGAAGRGAYASDGGAVGFGAQAENGFAGGLDAVTFETNASQIGTGTNTNNNTIQFLSAGSVTTNAWTALANSTAIGQKIMQAPTNGTNGQVLVWTNNDVVWGTSAGGGTADLTNVTGVLARANGGTGGTNYTTALAGLGIFNNSTGLVGSVVLGQDASSGAAASGNVAIGPNAATQTATSGANSVAVGRGATTTNTSTVALGGNARAAAINSAQIGTGTNSTSTSIQFRSAGAVTTNQWTALADSTTLGHGNMKATIATNAPANTNAPTPDAWMLVTEGTNNYYLPLWQ